MRKNLVLAALVLATAPALFAATATSGLNNNNITASVAAQCKINTFSIGFGAYDTVTNTAGNLAGGINDTTGTNLDVFCTKGTTPTSIVLSAGSNAANAAFSMTRAMKHTTATSYLSYDLFTKSDMTGNWTTGVAPEASTGKADPLTFSTGTAIKIYGTVPAGQDPVAGSYQDTVTATVTF